MAYERKDYTGGAASTTLSAGINGTATSITIASSTGWPSGSNGPFVVVIDEGTASEEKVLVASRSGTTLTVTSSAQRGYDGTSAAAHSSGATIKHCLTATDLDEANYWVAELAAAVNTAGDLAVADANNSLTTLAKGSNSTVLAVDSGGTLGYTTVTSAMIADGTIVNADINSSAAIALSKLATDPLARANHTGTQASTTVSDFDEAAQDAVGGILTDTSTIDFTYSDATPSITADVKSGSVTKTHIATSSRYQTAVFARAGSLGVETGQGRLYFPAAVTIVDAWASVGTAPTGASLIVDVNHNGTSIFTTQSRRPTITASGFYDLSETPDGDVTVAAGEYLTVDIDQVGSTIAGSDLTVGVRYYEDA